MSRFACLSLLTDYGLEDGFVAACHGVIARLAPGMQVIDVTHLIPPGDVRRAAAVLAHTLPYLPTGVHVAVVDPGVGTARRAIALTAGPHVLVGPDNGLLPQAADRLGGITAVREITNAAAMLHPVSATFHGRDVFAPAAARLAAGAISLEDLGPDVDPASLARLPHPTADAGDGYAAGEVLTVDRFGNVQTTVTGAQVTGLAAAPGARLRVGERLATCGETFGSVPLGELVAYLDSAGLLALAVNGGNAALTLGLRTGDPVRLVRA